MNVLNYIAYNVNGQSLKIVDEVKDLEIVSN